MDENESKKKDYLTRWRERRRLSPEDVDQALKYPKGTIQKFELYGFAKVPARELIRVLYFYRVPMSQVYKAIEQTHKASRKDKI